MLCRMRGLSLVRRARMVIHMIPPQIKTLPKSASAVIHLSGAHNDVVAGVPRPLLSNLNLVARDRQSRQLPDGVLRELFDVKGGRLAGQDETFRATRDREMP
jgi:hypothetical protein